ncbi:MAG: hypothetical protein LBH25_13010 [Fibromonadaceae bacterium]|jgi:hypothetical protein|nr:hypothetical protein [Fibromonadaceae bacterium]
MNKYFLLLFLILAFAAHAAELSLSRYARFEHGMLSKEYDMEGGRAYWIDGVSILGLPDAGADVMGFSNPARRLPLGFSGLYTTPPIYERYGLSINASNGNLIFKENYNPIDTPITELLWERYGLEGNAFRLNFNRLLLDSITFSLGLATHSTARSGDFHYQDIVHQLYTGTIKRDSSRVPLAGRNLSYNSFHAVPAVSWIFPHSSITAQMSYLLLNNDDATRDFFSKNTIGTSLTFKQNPYNIEGSASFYRFLWNCRFLPNWELSLSHRFAEQDFKFSKLDTSSSYFPKETSETYSAQTGESKILHKTFLNPHIRVNYEYLKSSNPQSLYQDRQLLLLGISDSLWRTQFRGESGLQRNASALDSVDFAPALYLGLTLHLPWHLQLNGDYQRDTRFPDFHETHILRTGRIAFLNENLKAEKRQRWESSLMYKLSETFFYAAGFRYEESINSIMPYWALLGSGNSNSLPASSAFMWANVNGLLSSNVLFWRLGFELGNWRFYAEQGKTVQEHITISTPPLYYKGTVYWSNRFVEDRLKVSVQFDADWFGNRWDYGLESEKIAKPIYLRKYLFLNFKSAMQIQEFILYARIENMNHSLMEPEVGYTPPGIRFAYGIEWILSN